MRGVVVSTGGSSSVSVSRGVGVISVEVRVASVGVCSKTRVASMLYSGFFKCFFIAEHHILSFVKKKMKK